MEGTANQISTTTGTNKVTFSIPSAFTAPGSIDSTSTITAATGLTVTAGGAAITGNSTIAGNLTVTGNATIDGTTTFLETTNVQTVDKVLRLAMEDSADHDYDDAATAVAATTGSGIEVVTDTIANDANFAQLVWNNNATTMTGWSIRDTGSSQTVYGIAALDRGAANPSTTPTTGALFYNSADTSGTKGLYVYID